MLKALIPALLILIVSTVCFSEDFEERPDWKHFFTDQAVEGTIVIIDERAGGNWTYNAARALKHFSPASTLTYRYYQDSSALYKGIGIEMQGEALHPVFLT